MSRQDLSTLVIRRARDVVVGDQVYGFIRTPPQSAHFGQHAFMLVEKIIPIYHPLIAGDAPEHRRLSHWRFEDVSGRLHLTRKPGDLVIVNPVG